MISPSSLGPPCARKCRELRRHWRWLIATPSAPYRSSGTEERATSRHDGTRPEAGCQGDPHWVPGVLIGDSADPGRPPDEAQVGCICTRMRARFPHSGRSPSSGAIEFVVRLAFYARRLKRRKLVRMRRAVGHFVTSAVLASTHGAVGRVAQYPSCTVEPLRARVDWRCR